MMIGETYIGGSQFSQIVAVEVTNPFNIKNLVGEIVSVSGLGNIQCNGALPAGRAFSPAYINGETNIPVKLEQLDHSREVSRWELCLCTYSAITNSLTRDSVLLSSNNNLPVFFEPGYYKRAFVFIPEEALPGGSASVQNTVLYTLQSLVESEKKIARKNISAGVITLTAGSALSALRIIVSNNGVAEYADNVTNYQSIAGISITSAGIGSQIEVQTSDELLDNSWNWVLGSIYLGANGVLTQTVPTVGSILEVGVALSPTKMMIRIQKPIILI
jgi:hypothetical protein